MEATVLVKDQCNTQLVGDSVLGELERSLISPIPTDYRAFLQKDPPDLSEDYLKNNFIPLHFYDPSSPYALNSFPGVLKNFLREWHPLRGSLLPVEYLGKGLFACFHLDSPSYSEPPIVLWDISADIIEQTLSPLAPDWAEYIKRRLEGFHPADNTSGERRERRRIAAAELDKAVKSFNRFSEWFQQNYQQGNQGQAFEHDQLSQLPRFDSWRPERFCVHDNLIGVMGYRVNRNSECLEVAGFATRDHTNYARASGMQALLLSLLCEWVRQSCKKGIVFVDDWDKTETSTLPIPYDIALYGHLLGADIKPNLRELTFETCRKLFLRLTSFGGESQKFLEDSELSLKACLMAHKGVWSISQIEDFLCFCPLAKELFEGSIAPEEQIQMAMLLEHARMCVMAGMAEQIICMQTEEKEKTCYCQRSATNDDALPYSRMFKSEIEIQLTCLTEKGKVTATVQENISFLMAVWPANRMELELNLSYFIDRVHDWSLKNISDKTPIFLLVPEESSLGLKPSFFSKDIPIQLALLSESYEAINAAAFQRIQQARRMRS